MKTCVYIVSFPRDYQLLQWAVRSLQKFLVGDLMICIIVPAHGELPPPLPTTPHPVRIVTVEEPAGKGFLLQMILKCQPDMYAPGFDSYIHWDSDCFLTRLVDASVFTQPKPVVYHGTYQSLFPKAGHLKLWQRAVQRCLGFTPEHEFMRCFPISFPASVYPSTRTRIERMTRRRFDEYVLNTRNEFPQTFAEFNTLGAWAWIEHRKEMAFRDWSNGPEWGWDLIHQYWAPGGPDFRAVAGSCIGMTPRETAAKLGIL
jgi:hypothetical protein